MNDIHACVCGDLFEDHLQGFFAIAHPCMIAGCNCTAYERAEEAPAYLSAEAARDMAKDYEAGRSLEEWLAEQGIGQ